MTTRRVFIYPVLALLLWSFCPSIHHQRLCINDHSSLYEMSNASSTIPSWATKVVDVTKDDVASTTTSTRKSADLFRVECARTWQQRIYQAQRKAWNDTVQDMLRTAATSSIEGKMTQSSSSSFSSSLADYYSIEAPKETDYSENDDLLPMTIISPPPSCRLDRQAMAEATCNHYDENHNDRCCTLWLPRLLPTLHATLHLLVRHCLTASFPPVTVGNNGQRDDFQCQAAKYFRKQQKKRHVSMQQLLLWWAARTSCYDSMVIVLEDVGGFAQARVWKDFLMTIQEWRQDYGLPVSLVVFGHNVSIQGEGAQLRLRYIQPSYELWLRSFCHDLIWTQRQETPFPLTSMDRLYEWVQHYTIEHGSLSRFCHDVEMCITEWYSPQFNDISSWVWDALEVHPSFLAWFSTYGTAKKWLSTQAGSTKYTVLEECHQIQQQLMWWWKWQAKLLPILMTSGNNNNNNNNNKIVTSEVAYQLLKPLAELYSWLIQTEKEPSSASLPPEMERYLDRAEKRATNKSQPTSESQSISLSSEQTQAKTLLYELIILIGTTMDNARMSTTSEAAAAAAGTTAAITGTTRTTTTCTTIPKISDLDRMEGIYRMIHELCEIVSDSMESLLEKWMEANPLAKRCDKTISTKTKTKGSRSHRQHVTPGSSFDNEIRSLQRPCHHRKDLIDGLTSPARELYGLLQDRWSIPREEWLYQFGGSPHDFVQGIWMLVLTGLVQAKTKRAGNTGTMVYYEKVSVVWCG